MRTLVTFLVGSLLLVSACGQEQKQADESDMETSEASEQEMKQSAEKDTMRAEWKIRLDNPSTKSKDKITVEKTDQGYHFVTGPRAIFYQSGMTAKGSYKFKATFTQNNQPGPEAYGLFVGGENLQSEDQQYLYFLIRQNGEYLIKRRVGTGTEMIVDWTPHDAIVSVDDSDQPVNALAVDAQADSLHFMINEMEVDALSRDELQYTEGQAGLRINHKLDLSVDGIELSAE